MNQRQKHCILITAILTILTSTILTSTISAQDEFRVGVVDIQKVFREYYKTNEVQNEISISRTILQKTNLDDRAKIYDFQKRVQSESEILFSKESKLSEEERRAQTDKVELLKNQLQTQIQTLRDTHTVNIDKLDSQMKLKMDAILADIQKLAKVHSEKANLQITFDISGQTSNQLPAFFPTAKTIDITSHLIQELNKQAPTKTK